MRRVYPDEENLEFSKYIDNDFLTSSMVLMVELVPHFIDKVVVTMLFI